MPINSVDFANAYERHYDRTVRVLSSRGLSGDVAQEFAQRAWVRAWERRSDLRHPARLPQWVNSIAINAFRSWFRQYGRERQLDAAGALESSGQTVKLVVEDLLSRTKTYRRILESFYFWGYSAEEIATAYNTTPLAIRVRLSRARALLRNQINRQDSPGTQNSAPLSPSAP